VHTGLSCSLCLVQVQLPFGVLNQLCGMPNFILTKMAVIPDNSDELACPGGPLFLLCQRSVAIPQSIQVGRSLVLYSTNHKRGAPILCVLGRVLELDTS
jgi:hypothetical protein